MNFYWLLLGVLSTWRITHFVQAEDGPRQIMVRFRGAMGNGFFGKLLDCFLCTSLWIAIPFACLLGTGILHGVLLWLSFSAGAILLQRLTIRDSASPLPFYTEDKE
jgi:hypothetical protein